MQLSQTSSASQTLALDDMNSELIRDYVGASASYSDIWRFLKIGVRIVTIGIPAAKMTKHLDDNQITWRPPFLQMVSFINPSWVVIIHH